MPLRRTKRSNGRQRPRWKDGSHLAVVTRAARSSPRHATVRTTVTDQREPPAAMLPTPEIAPKTSFSSRRNLRWCAGADAGLHNQRRTENSRLAIRPYGKVHSVNLDFRQSLRLRRSGSTCRPARAKTRFATVADGIADKRVPRGGRIPTAADSKSSILGRSTGTAAPTQPPRPGALPVANAPPCQCTPETPRPLPANARPPSPASSIRIDRSEEHPPRIRDVAGHSMRCAAHG